MAVAIDSFVFMSSSELATFRTRIYNELIAQPLVGGSFGRQGNHQKTGVEFERLTETLKAIDYAIAVKAGTIATETIADLSGAEI